MRGGKDLEALSSVLGTTRCTYQGTLQTFGSGADGGAGGTVISCRHLQRWGGVQVPSDHRTWQQRILLILQETGGPLDSPASKFEFIVCFKFLYHMVSVMGIFF